MNKELKMNCLHNRILMDLPMIVLLFCALYINPGYAADGDNEYALQKNNNKPVCVYDNDSCFPWWPARWTLGSRKKIACDPTLLTTNDPTLLATKNSFESKELGTENSLSINNIECLTKTKEESISRCEVTRKAIKILFVDDTQMQHTIIKRIVENINKNPELTYTIDLCTCYWGYQAFDCFNAMPSSGLPPHIILTDIKMESFLTKNDEGQSIMIKTKAGVEFARALRGKKDSDECYISLYKNERLSGESEALGEDGKYRFTNGGKERSITTFKGLVFALTSDGPDSLGDERLLFTDVYGKITSELLGVILNKYISGI